MKNKIFQFFRRVDWIINKRILRRKYFIRNLKDFSMYLDLHTPGISKTLAVYKSREDDMIQVIKDELKPGMTIIDCGSNIGFYPLLESHVLHGNGLIYAIEPDPRNYKILKKNLEICPHSKMINPFKIALSNKNGTTQMYIAKQSNLNKLFASDNKKFIKRHDIDEVIDTTTITMDDFCKKEEINPDFIRMDIEGFEVEVFQGMNDVLLNAKSGFMIFVELHPHAYSKDRSFADRLKYLMELGFFAKVLISAGEPVPPKYKELGYKPEKIIHSDGFLRGYYNNINAEDVIQLTCENPKASRYILLQKG